MNAINYAKVYSDTLAQAYPYALNFGALYATPNNGRFRFSGGKDIELPVITTSGRIDASRDSTDNPTRNYENEWETKHLSRQRKWSTLIHPQDIDQTNYAATISGITAVFNSEQKFPEMDAYTVSKLYADWTAEGNTPTEISISAENVLSTFDTLMAEMTEARVPTVGRILYVTPSVMLKLKACSAVSRGFDVTKAGGEINRNVTTLDGVTVVEVPSELMKTLYSFTNGWSVDSNAEQIGMLLIHPDAVITPVSYQFACLDEPSATTGGKYVYYEESFEDVFILNQKASGIAFVLDTASAAQA